MFVARELLESPNENDLSKNSGPLSGDHDEDVAILIGSLGVTLGVTLGVCFSRMLSIRIRRLSSYPVPLFLVDSDECDDDWPYRSLGRDRSENESRGKVAGGGFPMSRSGLSKLSRPMVG